MLASARTFALLGIEAREVQVEADVASGGLPSFSLVGLPDPAVRESRERVRSALVNSGLMLSPHGQAVFSRFDNEALTRGVLDHAVMLVKLGCPAAVARL